MAETTVTQQVPSYPGISAKAFEHPADRAATAALNSIPVVDRVVKKLSELRFERAFSQRLLANAVRIGPGQVPSLWTSYQGCLDALDLGARPALYVMQTPESNAMTFGSTRPVVLVSSRMAATLDPTSLQVVLAHETGHILCDHSYYLTLLAILQRLVQLPLSLVGQLPVRALLLVLLEWFRAAELSCDRAATLVVGDPMATCRALMHVAGGSLPGMDVDAFVQQAAEYGKSDDLLSMPSRFMSEVASTHPFPVRRVNELIRWVSDGDYDRIRGGSYLRRGQEPPASEEFRAAVDHYRQRFVGIIDSVSGGVQSLTRQVTEWLRDPGAWVRGDGG
jgi:Zn-dependent protease with chaperone function